MELRSSDCPLSAWKQDSSIAVVEITKICIAAKRSSTVTGCLKDLVSTSALSEVSGLDLLTPKVSENAPNDALRQNLKFSRDESKVLRQLLYQKLQLDSS